MTRDCESPIGERVIASPVMVPRSFSLSGKQLGLISSLLVSFGLLAVGGWLFWKGTRVTYKIPEINLDQADWEVAESIQQAREAVKSSPRSAASWGHLAMVLHTHGVSGAADHCYTVASDLDKRDPTWPYLQGFMHHDGPAGPEVSLPLYERAALLSPPNSIARLRLADLLFELGRIEDAHREYLTLLADDPNDANALLGLGAVAESRGQYRDALRFLLPIVAEVRAQKRTCALLVNVYEHLGELESAQRERERLATLPDTFPRSDRDPLNQVASLRVGLNTRIEKASALREQQRFGEMLAALQETVARHPDSDEAWSILGIELQRSNDLKGAEQAMQRSISLAPKSAKHRFSLGMLQYSQQRYKEAEETFRRTLELKPTFGPAYFGLGECLKSLNDPIGAAEAYAQTLRYMPEHELARQCLESLPDAP